MKKKALPLNNRGKPATKPGADFKSVPYLPLTIPSQKHDRNVAFFATVKINHL
jgi:hypothetical protein